MHLNENLNVYIYTWKYFIEHGIVILGILVIYYSHENYITIDFWNFNCILINISKAILK